MWWPSSYFQNCESVSWLQFSPIGETIGEKREVGVTRDTPPQKKCAVELGSMGEQPVFPSSGIKHKWDEINKPVLMLYPVNEVLCDGRKLAFKDLGLS